MEELANAANKVLAAHKLVAVQYTDRINTLKKLIIAAFVFSGVFMVLRSKDVGFTLPAMYLFNISLYAGLLTLILRRTEILLLYIVCTFAINVLYCCNFLALLVEYFNDSLIVGDATACYPVKASGIEVVMGAGNVGLMLGIAFCAVRLLLKARGKDSCGIS